MPSESPPEQQVKPESSLSQGFARSVRLNTYAEMGVQLLRVGGFVLVARALEPGDFGLFKLLVVISALTTLTCQFGIPNALVQKRDLRPDHEASGFWFSSGLTVIVIGSLYSGCWLIAGLMKMPAMVPSIRLLTIPLIIEAMSGIPAARLRRRLNFGPIASAEVAAEIVFLSTAMIFLWVLHLPRWSLVAGLAVRHVVHGSWIWIADGYVPRTLPRLHAFQEIAYFALCVWCGAALQTLSANIDYFLVGRLLGPAALGFYAMAWDLLRFVPDRLHRIAGRVTLPEFCRLQNSDRELGQAYVNFLGYVALIVLPIIACVAVAAPVLIGVLYGPRWVPTALPLRLLAPGVALIGLRLGMSSVFLAKNRPVLDIYFHLGRLALVVLVVWELARYGIGGVALGMTSVESLVTGAGLLLACRMAGLKITDLATPVFAALETALVCGVSAAVGKYLGILAGFDGALLLPFIAVPPSLLFWFFHGRTLIRFFVRPKVHSSAPDFSAT
ncbi:MAG: oligosaccharide flippase family protein [Candidatus Binataceae bacterium]|nr:oligosaccharide flippase family protein [Candidatus Binataceae bacterium]